MCPALTIGGSGDERHGRRSARRRRDERRADPRRRVRPRRDSSRAVGRRPAHPTQADRGGAAEARVHRSARARAARVGSAPESWPRAQGAERPGRGRAHRRRVLGNSPAEHLAGRGWRRRLDDILERRRRLDAVIVGCRRPAPPELPRWRAPGRGGRGRPAPRGPRRRAGGRRALPLPSDPDALALTGRLRPLPGHPRGDRRPHRAAWRRRGRASRPRAGEPLQRLQVRRRRHHHRGAVARSPRLPAGALSGAVGPGADRLDRSRARPHAGRYHRRLRRQLGGRARGHPGLRQRRGAARRATARVRVGRATRR